MRSVTALLLLLLALAHPASSAVTVHLLHTDAPLTPRWAAGDQGLPCQAAGGPFNYRLRATSTTAGSTDSTAAFLPPSGSAPGCDFQDDSDGNAYQWWVTPQISGTFTIAGSISGTVAGAESVAQANFGGGFRVYKWDGRRGGITALIWTSNNTSSEFNGGDNCQARSLTGSNPTSTGVVAGDRLIIIPELRNVGGAFNPQTQPPRLATVCFGGSNGGNFDSFVTFNETLTFSADSGVTTQEQMFMGHGDPWWLLRAQLASLRTRAFVWPTVAGPLVALRGEQAGGTIAAERVR